MRVWLLLVGIAVGVGASWLWRTYSPPPPAARTTVTVDADDDTVPAAVSSSDAPAHLKLQAAARELADIQTAQVQRTTAQIEHYTPARVLDGGELLAALRERRAARSALATQQALVASQRARLERLRGFAARGEITVARELNALELSVRRELDVAASRAAQLEQREAQLRARWGASLATYDGLEATLATGDAQLVEFAASEAPTEVFVGRDEQRAQARRATVLGAAPAALGTAAASTWIGLVNDRSLRVGMRLSVWVPQGDAALEGVLLPASAVVWHAGAQWYYLESARGEFERRRLPAVVKHALGLIVSAGLPAGSTVVVHGAQALLAEELRQRIPSEDDD